MMFPMTWTLKDRVQSPSCVSKPPTLGKRAKQRFTIQEGRVRCRSFDLIFPTFHWTEYSREGATEEDADDITGSAAARSQDDVPHSCPI